MRGGEGEIARGTLGFHVMWVMFIMLWIFMWKSNHVGLLDVLSPKTASFRGRWTLATRLMPFSIFLAATLWRHWTAIVTSPMTDLAAGPARTSLLALLNATSSRKRSTQHWGLQLLWRDSQNLGGLCKIFRTQSCFFFFFVITVLLSIFLGNGL